MIIYKTTNIINGKFYIGQDSKNNPKYLGSGSILYNALHKYGKENFKKEILETCTTNKQLDEREKYWIKKLNAQDRKIGYNIANGGHNIKNLSPEKYLSFREKISKSRKGKTYEELMSPENATKIREQKRKYWLEHNPMEYIDFSGENNPFYGKTHSEEFKKKHSEFMKGNTVNVGRKHTDKAKANIKAGAKKRDLSGKKNPMYGKSVYDVWREKYGDGIAEEKIKNHKLNISKAAAKRRAAKLDSLKNK